MYHGEVSMPNKEVTLDTDCGSESSIKEKHMDTQTPIIFMHAIAFTMKTIHIPKTSRSNISTDNE